MTKSIITSKGQTTVPAEVRRMLGVGSGDALQWEVEGNTVRITVADRGFLRRQGALAVGRGSSVDDVRQARELRGTELS
ncbi:MAG: type II toxin-antitoxin system PrlF family antitoxin [Thermoanaerobaculaceae bacterium]|nr:type II toxin-antitoxin system PrlF family antitoxin [Thermoanaerobaculaceae bacterium]